VPPDRPWADLLLTTLALAHGSRVITAALSGRGNDAATGATGVWLWPARQRLADPPQRCPPADDGGVAGRQVRRGRTLGVGGSSPVAYGKHVS
jgi:hypothetical protein